MSLNASVALFVWHGGSNFGLESGALETTTSYDYDAPLSEAGQNRDAFDESRFFESHIFFQIYFLLNLFYLRQIANKTLYHSNRNYQL